MEAETGLVRDRQQASGTGLPEVLHLAAWYPTADEPWRTPFIPAQFHAAAQQGRHELIHVEVLHRSGPPRLRWGRHRSGERYRLLDLPTRQTRVVELATLLLLVVVRLELGRRWWDGVHVHIAWPLLRFPRLFLLLFGSQVLIGEHWSAYHHNFNLPEGSAGQRRLAQMFSHQLPVATVSQALAADIRRFASRYRFPIVVIPNVVDATVFHPSSQQQINRARSSEPHQPRFLMVATWQPIKRPLLVLQAAELLRREGLNLQIRIVGVGPQLPAMQAQANAPALAGQVEFLGALSKTEIAEEMRQADALLHPSAYETFSVVCAEAISCGTPVLVSNLEAVAEFIDDSNGILVSNTVDAWRQAITVFCAQPQRWQTEALASAAHARFSPKVVGQKFRDLYRELWRPSC